MLWKPPYFKSLKVSYSHHRGYWKPMFPYLAICETYIFLNVTVNLADISWTIVGGDLEGWMPVIAQWPGQNGKKYDFLPISVKWAAKNLFSAASSSMFNFRPLKALGTSQLVLIKSPGTSCCCCLITPLSSRQKRTVQCTNILGMT